MVAAAMAVVAATVVDSISSATATVVATYSSGSYCLAASVAEATDSAASIPIIRMGEYNTPPFLLQNKFLKEIWITLCFPNPLTFFYSLKQSIKAVSAILSFIFRPLQPFPLPLPFCAIQSAPLTGKQWKCLM